MTVVDMCFLNSCCMFCVIMVVSVGGTVWIGEVVGCSIGVNLGWWFITFLFLFLCLFCFVKYCSTILIMDKSALCCMSVQNLARFMGKFSLEM